MSAYLVRIISAHDQAPSGWVGIVVAPNKKALFWEIDEHCDPYSVEIKPLTSGSIMAYTNTPCMVETSEGLLDVKWAKPDWSGLKRKAK